ncbi:MAG TPA: DNA translocase FtsK [Candidatus Dormibacteraeota bacterium]|nr:DNA translocase FtsK [Candidatus Dormibacteraeota bacterium]
MRLLTPTENRRLNELIGFLAITCAVLIALSLFSYSPRDPSFNVSAPAPAVHAINNWIGPFGAYLADILFQGFGYAAFLLPVGLLLFGKRWFRSQPLDSPVAKLIGYGLLLLSLPSLLVLWHFPDVRGSLPPGGLLGGLCSSGLTAGFNALGANVVTFALFLTAVFLTTQFSFSGAHAWLRSPGGPVGALDRLGIWQKAQARWKAYREERLQQRMRKRIEATKIAGRPPAPLQTVGLKEQPKKTLAEDADERDEGDDERDEAQPAPVLVMHPEASATVSKSGREPKIVKGVTSYRLPSPSLLRMPERSERIQEDDLKECARAIEAKTKEFGVEGQVTQINPGPVVTTFEFKPEAGIKYSRITSLAEDLCLALRAESILIERIPGKSTVGIEVPNHHRQTIALRENIESPEFVNSPSKLTLAMGKDLIGRIRISDLTQMPHLLIAGSTGTGKSVFINAMLISMLYKATPDELKLVLVDPKQLELNLYEDIPHLLAPVVTNPKVASNVLRNATREMEKRLKLLAQRGVRNIEQYNRTFQRGQSLSLFDNIEETEHKPLPYIVIVIDELADLMMVDTNNVEEAITRLAQMARAVGIHLLLATQRPSVDVITGLIKANFPARVSFRVASKVDSRTILDANGSESLLGRGDMLYLPAGSARLHRIHGPLVTETEVGAVCDFWRAQAKAKYNEQLLEAPKEEASAGEEQDAGATEEVDDELYQQAVRVVCEMGRASTSTLQRRLRVGYGRAARLIDIMEKDGIVGPPDGTKPREVLKKEGWMKEFDDRLG